VTRAKKSTFCSAVLDFIRKNFYSFYFNNDDALVKSRIFTSASIIAAQEVDSDNYIKIFMERGLIYS